VLLLCCAVNFTAGQVDAQDERDAPKIERLEVLESVGLKGKELVQGRANYGQNLAPAEVVERGRELSEKLGKEFDWERPQRMGRYRMGVRDRKDPSATLEIDRRSGNFLFNRGLAKYRAEEETPGLVKFEQGRERALEHLEKLDLVPDKEQLVDRKVGGLSMAVRLDNGETKIYRKLVTVRFGRRLGGFPVMGDSRIVVHLGTEGELAGMIYQWPEVAVKAVDPEALRDDRTLKNGIESRLKAGSRGAARAVVQKADLVMYDDGRGIVEPAYHVEARLFYEVPAGEGAEEERTQYDIPFDFYVPVLKRPRGFYPYMEKAPVQPTDARGTRVRPTEDE